MEVLQVVGSKLVGIYHRKTHRKNYDDCLINVEVSKNFNFGNLKSRTVFRQGLT